MVSNQNSLHIRLENDEALESKRSFLASQIALLRILKTVKSYRMLRSQEIQLKLELAKKMRELRTEISEIEKVLPKVKAQGLLKTSNTPERQYLKKTTPVKDLSIENQLYEIQRRLNELQSRNY